MKTITPDNYVVRPFLTHKTQGYNYTFLSGSNPPQISIDVAVAPPTASWIWSAAEPINASGIYQRALYASIKNMFVTSGSFITGSTLYVVSVSQGAHGEGIRPKSFVLASPSVTASLFDDGNGNIVTSSNTGSIVGYINYGLGVVVINGHISGGVISNTGMNLTTGSALAVTFDATHTIYEHQIICTMNEGEFNFSTNPSMNDRTAPRRLDLFASGVLPPYMTTIGLYTDTMELVAIGKFPRAIKRVPESQQTVIIRFDV